MATMKPGRHARTVTRRDFLLLSAAAAGVSAVSLKPRESAGADAPKKGGTLRVGFYI